MTADHRTAALPAPASRDAAPLTPNQARLWFGERLHPGHPGHVVQRALALHGPPDVPALRRTLHLLTERHDILRTVYRGTAAGPRQRALPTVPDVLHTAGDHPGGPDEWIRQIRHRPFDLETGPVLRWDLLRTGASEHVLLLTVHHIAFDGVSMRLLFDELATAYAAFHHGTPPQLPPAPSFLDFARRTAGTRQADGALAYWTAALAGAGAAPALPHDFAPAGRGSGRAHARTFRVPDPARARLAALARQERCSPFMATLALFAALLCSCAAARDVVVAIPVAERAAPEHRRLVGFLVNLAPARVACAPHDTLPDLLARTREAVLGAAEHPLPYQQAVAAARTSGPGTGLVRAAFDLHPAPRTPRLPGLDVTERPVHPVATRFEVELHVQQRGDAWDGTFLVSADLFEADAADALADLFVALADRWTADPGLPLTAVEDGAHPEEDDA
ncbi:condensation domain-containing protein [Streptomyces sp. IBSBF 2435]|uniref:condensation domain-containing protein n=1 Tax=Streptomyces sp. IBSBF 2435 TaxID=2903531 RepID=UPI002FDC6DEA